MDKIYIEVAMSIYGNHFLFGMLRYFCLDIIKSENKTLNQYGKKMVVLIVLISTVVQLLV